MIVSLSVLIKFKRHNVIRMSPHLNLVTRVQRLFGKAQTRGLQGYSQCSKPSCLLKKCSYQYLQAQRTAIAKHLPSSMKQNKMEVQDIRRDALNIFHAAVDSVYPPRMLRNAMTLSGDGDAITVDGRTYHLQNNVYIIGFGKAVSGMARTLEDMIGKHIVEGIISIPHGCQDLFRSIGKQELCLTDGSKIQVFEGAENNLPDDNSYSAAVAIEKLADALGEDDILIVLISGGGSALLPLPFPPVTLQDELEMTRVVSSHGGSIQDLNILRQNLEVLKGGGLARIAKPATVISLILSDVIDDKLEIIGSGPTVPLLSSPRQCLQILERLNVKDKIPRVILQKFEEKVQEKLHHTSRLTNEEMEYVQNFIIGSNTLATQAAQKKAREKGYVPYLLTNSLTGEARTVGTMFSELAKYVILTFGDRRPDKGLPALGVTEVSLTKYGLTKLQLKGVKEAATNAYNSKSGLCLICGGETTVNVRGSGKGGRNQEMALSFAVSFHKTVAEDKTGVLQKYHVEFLSAGTDGQDGPTDAAGAVVNEYLIPAAISRKLNPTQYLDNNDSYNLFKAVTSRNDLIQCGLTGTNVMDIQLLMVKFLI